MTDTLAHETLVDDVDDTRDSISSRLSRQADAILSGGTDDRPERLRQAIRDDLGQGCHWAAEQAGRARSVIRDEPIRAAAYAVGIGILVGLLLRR